MSTFVYNHSGFVAGGCNDLLAWSNCPTVV